MYNRQATAWLTARILVATVAICFGSLADGQSVSGAALVSALHQGGYVIVMRHAHAPDAPPSAKDADPANRKRERQLDPVGQSTALDMGSALRKLRLPIGAVWSSPTYRARQTVRLAGLPAPKVAAQLGDGGRSMQAATSAQARWLRALANRRPKAGSDTVIVTQYPNIKAAFGNAVANMKDGEALVLRPAKGAPRPVGRIAIDQWSQLAGKPQSRTR